jgi:hypothetical protein
MDDVVTMKVGEHLQQLQRDVHRPRRVERPIFEELGHGLTRQVLEHQVGPLPEYAKVAQRHAVRVVKTAHRHRLALEPPDKFGVPHVEIVQDLHRHLALGTQSARAVHHADAAAADRLEQLITTVQHATGQRCFCVGTGHRLILAAT